MVLSPSPAHDQEAPLKPSWIERIKLGLRVSPSGILILATGGGPAELTALLRELVPDHPDLDIHTEVRDIDDKPAGAAFVLAPEGDDAAAWLNLRRPMFARNKLRVVLWCDRDTSVKLMREAPDFSDWISQYYELKRAPVPHAVSGIRCALAARAPGIAWNAGEGSGDRLKEIFTNVRSKRELRWLDPFDDYDALVSELASGGTAWVACAALEASHARRFRWALAESRRRSRAIAVTSLSSRRMWFPAFHPVHDQVTALPEARNRLARAGASQPGLLAGLTGLEPEAVELAGRLLEGGAKERALIDAACSPDPGASLARLAERNLFTLNDLAGDHLDLSIEPPVVRAFGGTQDVRTRRERTVTSTGRSLVTGKVVNESNVRIWAAFAKRGAPLHRVRGGIDVLTFAAEPLLRSRPVPAGAWVDLARTAAVAGEMRAAAAWAIHAIASKRPRVEAIRQVAYLLEFYGDLRDAEEVRQQIPPESLYARITLLGPYLLGGIVIAGNIAAWLLVLYALPNWLYRIAAISLLLSSGGELLALPLGPPSLLAIWLWEKYRLHALRRQDSCDLDQEEAAINAVTILFERDARRQSDSVLILSARFGRSHPVVRLAIERLAASLLRQDKGREALDVLCEAVDSAGRTDGVDHGAFAALMPSFADTLNHVGRFRDAEKVARKLLQADVRMSFERFPRARWPLGLPLMRSLDRRFGQALPLPPPETEQPLQIDELRIERLLSDFLTMPIPRIVISQAQKANTLRVWADAVGAQGRHDEAEPLAREALELAERTYGHGNAAVCAFLGSLSYVLLARGQVDHAERTLRKLIQIHESEPTGEKIDVDDRMRALLLLADIEHRLGKPSARETVRQARLYFNPSLEESKRSVERELVRLETATGAGTPAGGREKHDRGSPL